MAILDFACLGVSQISPLQGLSIAFFFFSPEPFPPNTLMACRETDRSLVSVTVSLTSLRAYCVIWGLDMFTNLLSTIQS